jgi:RNA polymerase sigma-70 factor (sigma-E family)
MGRPPTDDEFTELVHASWASLYRTALLLVGDRGLAEDLVQTALAKTYAAWRTVRDPQLAHAYARRVLVNTATEWFRKKSWRNEIAAEVLPEPAYHPDHTTHPLVMDALRLLAPRQRAVIVLRYYEDQSVSQVADVLGCTEGTVKSQTFDALERLRTHLGDAVISQPDGASS